MAAQRQAAITTEAASRIGMTDTPIVPDAAVAARSRLLRPAGRRFPAAHWDTLLPPAETAEKWPQRTPQYRSSRIEGEELE